jgi:hypothetical protein
MRHKIFDDDLDLWDEVPSRHWLRRIILAGLGIAVAYFVMKGKKSLAPDPLTSTTSFRPVSPSEPEGAPADRQAVEDEGWEKLTPSQGATEADTVIDVAAAELTIVDGYVLSDDIGEDDEIDLALEEDIENDNLDDDFEGVLADDDLNESILEPSPREDVKTWVAPVDGECPDGYPIKARFSTGRFHVPGDRGYEKINADCCYATIEDAEADGFTHSRWS